MYIALLVIAALASIDLCEGSKCYVCYYSLSMGVQSPRCAMGGAPEFLKDCPENKCLVRDKKHTYFYHYGKNLIERACAESNAQDGCTDEKFGDTIFGGVTTTCICTGEACNTRSAGGKQNTVFAPYG